MKIKEAAQRSGLSAKTVRYYEECRLLTVSRSANTYREYSEENVQELLRIRQMRELGIAVADIRLWTDGVISTRELLNKRRAELEKENRLGSRQRELCEALLAGRTVQQAEQAFAESDSVMDGPVPVGPFVLGVDIGTTTVSAQVLSLTEKRPAATCTVEHHAALTLPEAPDAYAEDAEALLSRAEALVRSLCASFPDIRAIGITGQMHGIVCLGEGGEVCSPLYTWQNAFGSRKADGRTLTEEIREKTGWEVPTGYGLCTCYALRRLGMFPAGAAKTVTIMDALAARLCGAAAVPMHPTNAAGLGLYDLATGAFDLRALERLGIPATLLPAVRAGYGTVGRYGDIPVSMGIGDNQAGLFASLREEGQVLVNVGTGSQVSRIADSAVPVGGGIEVRPYLDGRYIRSGAALCGGRAYAALADFVKQTLAAFGVTRPGGEVYACLNRLAAQATAAPTVDTCFSGTRADPQRRGRIDGLGLDTFLPGPFARGVLEGIVRELHDFDLHMGGGTGTPVLSGNAMRKNPVLRRLTEEIFGTSCLVPAHTEEAAYGAALYGAVSAGVLAGEEAGTFISYVPAQGPEEKKGE